MNLKDLFDKLKKRGLSILFFSFAILIIFSPDAKSWLLQKMVSAGLFNIELNKDEVNKNLAENISFSFTDSNGKTLATSDLKGKVVFINLWASWCPPCRAEMSSLNELYLKLSDDDRFTFLFMNEDEDKAKAIKYIEKNHFIIPLYNRSGEVSSEIFSGTLPTTIVINKEGKIVLKHEGLAGYNTNKFILQLKGLSK